MIKVMFVCLGNICRSPMAEAILAHKVSQQNLSEFQTESCGTAGYQIGEAPDYRTIAVAEKHGVPINHKAQQLKPSHFDEFDYLMVMDQSNKQNALKVAHSTSEYELFLMRDFDTKDNGSEVADPWYGDSSDFEMCYQTLDRCISEFIHFLVEKHKRSV